MATQSTIKSEVRMRSQIFKSITLEILAAMVGVFCLSAGYLPHQTVRAQDNKPKESLTIEDIINGLEAVEKKIETLSVQLQVKLAMSFDMKTTNKNFTETWKIDRSGKGMNSSVGEETKLNEVTNEPQKHNFTSDATFDGNEGRRYSTTESLLYGKNEEGRIEQGLIRHGLSPFEFTTQMVSTPISQILRKGKTSVIGTQELNGRTVTIVEHRSSDDSVNTKSQVLVDISRNFLVVRQSMFSRESDKSDWRLSRSIDSLNHREIDGFWLPTIVLVREGSFSNNSSSNFGRKLDVICSAWKINSPLKESDLLMKFPQGLLVRGWKNPTKAPGGPFRNYVVDRVTTDFQRSQPSLNDAIGYAKIDVNSFVDPNTKEIELDKFDFKDFRAKLEEIAEVKREGMFVLSLAFREIQDDDRAIYNYLMPIFKERCIEAGLKNVRITSSGSFGGSVWQGFPAGDFSENDEKDLGDASVQVFEAQTRLSRFLLDNHAVLMQVVSPIESKENKLLDATTMKGIERAVAKLNGPLSSVKVRLTIEPTKVDNALPPDLKTFTEVNSDIQRSTVEFLYRLGFTEVTLHVNQTRMGGVINRYRKPTE